MWGLDVPDASDRHVTVSRDTSREVPGAVTHRNDLQPHEVTALDGTVVTAPLRTVVDCARMQPFGWGLAVADSAVRLRLATARDLREAVATTRGPGAAAARRVGRHCDGRAGSALESLMRALLIEQRIGPVAPQLRIVPGGHPYDLGIVRARTLIECDGARWHTDAFRVTRDSEDITVATVEDYVILRFGWVHVVHRAAWTIDAVRRTVTRQQRMLDRRRNGVRMAAVRERRRAA